MKFLSIVVEEFFALFWSLGIVDFLGDHSPISAGGFQTVFEDLDFVLCPAYGRTIGATALTSMMILRLIFDAG